MTAVHGRFTRSQTLIQNGESPSRCRRLRPRRLRPRSRVMSRRFLSGGEIDSVDKDGNTPLHVAARYGHELLINTLITSGADCTRWVCCRRRRRREASVSDVAASLRRRGVHGMFPLHLAALNAHADCCRKLLSSGTRPRRRWPWDQRVRHTLAFGSGQMRVTRLQQQTRPRSVSSS